MANIAGDKKKGIRKIRQIPIAVAPAMEPAEPLKKPHWIRVRAAAPGSRFHEVKQILRQARLHHPDNNPQDQDAACLFKDDHAAYRLLRYCLVMQKRAVASDAPESDFRCDLAEAATGGLLRVNISRSSELAARN